MMPPGLAAAAATKASPFRNLIVAAAGVVLLLLGICAVEVLISAARGDRGLQAHHWGLVLPGLCSTVAGLVLVFLAVTNAVEAARMRRRLDAEMHPGEAIDFAAMVMLPPISPTTGSDVLGAWRVGGSRTAMLVATDRRVVLLSTGGPTRPTLSWPRARVTAVAGRIDGRRSVLSVEVRGEGRLELWMRGAGELADAEDALEAGSERRGEEATLTGP